MKTISIETDRLHLRPCTEADIPALHKLWIHPNVRGFIWDDEVISEEKAREVVQRSMKNYQQHGAGVWVAHAKNRNRLVGFCGLGHYGKQPEKEILYGIDPQLWGNGYATEVSLAMLRYAFEELGCELVLAGADPLHEASFRVIDKLGMLFVRRAQSERADGTKMDLIYYGIKKDAFDTGEALYQLVKN